MCVQSRGLPFVVPTCLPGVVRQTVAAQLDAQQNELARIRAELAVTQVCLGVCARVCVAGTCLQPQ